MTKTRAKAWLYEHEWDLRPVAREAAIRLFPYFQGLYPDRYTSADALEDEVYERAAEAAEYLLTHPDERYYSTSCGYIRVGGFNLSEPDGGGVEIIVMLEAGDVTLYPEAK